MCVLVLAAGVNHITDISRAALGAVLVRDRELSASSAVPCYNPNNTGEITEMRQYVFTEWDPTATSDMEALASVFDTDGYGELSGAELADYRIMVMNADGTTSAFALAELGITSISLTADATNIELPDRTMSSHVNMLVMA